jgi:hypothetical protein
MYAAAIEYAANKINLKGHVRTAFVAGGVVAGLILLAKCEGSGPHP